MRATPCTRCFSPLPAEARFCVACGSEAPHPHAYAPGVPMDHGAPGGSRQPVYPMLPLRPPSATPVPIGLGPGSPAPGPEPAGWSAEPRGAQGRRARRRRTPGSTGAPRPMAVCVGCGVIAPIERSSCMLCQLDFPPVRPVVQPLPDDMFWVAVQCEFQCRACGHKSPLNHLDMDGSVVCLHCGINQVFDVSGWNDGLEHAHAVGDLAGPEPDGRAGASDVSIAGRNPFADIGVRMTYANAQQTGIVVNEAGMTPRSLSVTASPGHPLCGRCRYPLEVTGMRVGHVEVACARCGERAEYEVPAAAGDACAGLRGVIADEHRVGSREGRIEQSEGGAIAIRCPSCGGGVSISGASTIVDCQYCHVSLRIPAGALHRLGHERPRALLWWLLFTGPSVMRAELIHEERRARRKRRERGEPVGDPTPPPNRGIQRPRRETGPTAAGRALAIVIPLALLVLVGLIGFRDRVEAWTRPRVGAAFSPGPSGASGAASKSGKPGGPNASGDRTAGNGGSTAARPRAVLPVIDRDRFRRLSGCECKGTVAGNRVEVGLAVQVSDQSQPGVAPPVLDLGYFLDVGERSFQLEAGMEEAPPSRVTNRGLGIGVGCYRDIAVFAAGTWATGWSLIDGTRQWKTALPEPYRYRGRASREGISIHCASLSVRKDTVRIPVGKRGRAVLSATSGRRRR